MYLNRHSVVCAFIPSAALANQRKTGTMVNIIIGLVFVIGGLSGKLALRGLDSPGLLAALGAVMIVWGISQVVRRYRANSEYRQQRQQQEDQNPSPEFTPPADNP